ncbi:cupin domain-containing protein [Bacteroidota bacterium]
MKGFYKKNENDFKPLIQGINYKCLVYGEKTLLGEFRLKKDAIIPMHKHPHEQTGYVISGRMIFIIDKIRQEVAPGDSWCIKGNIEHGVEVLEDSVVIEIFSPVREEYLP